MLLIRSNILGQKISGLDQNYVLEYILNMIITQKITVLRLKEIYCYFILKRVIMLGWMKKIESAKCGLFNGSEPLFCV